MKYFIYVAFFCFLFIQCANVKPPTGGPIDEDVPVILYGSSTPDTTGVTNYKKDYIELKFSEKVKTANTIGEIIITPPINGSYSVDSYSNVVKLSFEEPLEENTTYTVNFGNSIVDVTEGNIAEDIIVSFSTGEQLDTLTISGTVYDNLSDKKMGGIIVGLYRPTDTTTILDGKPYYMVKTKEDGTYKIYNIKKGNYTIYALEDNKPNYFYDKGEDKIAFIPVDINLDTNVNELDLRLFQEVKYVTLKAINTSYSENYYEIEFNNKINNINLKSSLPINYKYEVTTKKLQIFKDSTYLDTLSLQVIAEDSLTSIDSTFKIKFPELNDKKRKAKANNSKLNLRVNSPKKGYLQDSLYIEILLTKPYKQFIPDSIYILSQKDTIPILKDTNIVLINKDPSKNQLAIIRYNNKYLQYQLVFKKGTFISFDGDTSNQVKKNLNKADYEEYGTLGGKITNPYKSIIVELINSNNSIVEKLYNPEKYHLMYLDADTYSFRVLIDSNGDRSYQYGNLDKRLIPEPIYFPNKTVKLKSNWEINDFNIEIPKTF